MEKDVFKEYFFRYVTELDKTISVEAALYALNGKGKRSRFLLSLNTAKDIGVCDENAIRLAIAVELIHNYSLIHDDLPIMDNSDFRRGKPSCHKIYGDAQAVLAGDGLLNLAAEVVLGGDNAHYNYLPAAKYIFECSGFNGMVGGQSKDVMENAKITKEEYFFLVKNKTAKLIEAAIVPQVIYANKNDNIVARLTDFAYNLGMAYQFADDLADAEEDAKKASILTYFDLPQAIKLVEKLCDTALNNLDSAKIQSQFLTNSVNAVLKRAQNG